MTRVMASLIAVLVLQVAPGLVAWTGRAAAPTAEPDAVFERMLTGADPIIFAEGQLAGREPGVMRIRKAGGAIGLESAPGGADVATGGGQILIGRSSGTVSARTGGGDINIGPAIGSVHARTGAGDVRVLLGGVEGRNSSADIVSGSGCVVIDLPLGIAAQLDLEAAYTESFNRRPRVDSTWNLRQQETVEWDTTHGTPRKYVRAHGQIGMGGGLIRVRTVNGDIAVRYGPS